MIGQQEKKIKAYDGKYPKIENIIKSILKHELEA